MTFLTQCTYQEVGYNPEEGSYRFFLSISEVKKAPVMSQCFDCIRSCVAIDIIVRIAVKQDVGAYVVEYLSSEASFVLGDGTVTIAFELIRELGW